MLRFLGVVFILFQIVAYVHPNIAQTYSQPLLETSEVTFPSFENNDEKHEKVKTLCQNQINKIRNILADENATLLKENIEEIIKEFKYLDELANDDNDIYIRSMIEGLSLFFRYKKYWNTEIHKEIEKYSDLIFNKSINGKTTNLLETQERRLQFFLRFSFGFLTNYGLNVQDLSTVRKDKCEKIINLWQQLNICNPEFDPQLPENQYDPIFPPDDSNIKETWINSIPGNDVINPDDLAVYEQWKEKRNHVILNVRLQRLFDNMIKKNHSDICKFIIDYYSIPPDTGINELKEMFIQYKCHEKFQQEIIDTLHQRIKEKKQLGIRIWTSLDGKILKEGYFKVLKGNIVTILSKHSFEPNNKTRGKSEFDLNMFCDEDRKLIKQLQNEKDDKNEEQTKN
jgi:hypothetical protein